MRTGSDWLKRKSKTATLWKPSLVKSVYCDSEASAPYRRLFFWKGVNSLCIFLLLSLLTLPHRSDGSDLFLPDLSTHLIREKQKLSVIFADRNTDIPESMFGHILLVAHNHSPPEPDAVIIEFVTRIEHPYISYPAALLWHTDGRYQLAYYFIKEQEYDLENRNLVILEVDNLTRSKDRLVGLLDKKTENVFPYTFLQYNCAYYIGKLFQESTDIPLYFQPVNRPVTLAQQLLPYSNRVETINSSQRNFHAYMEKLPVQYDFDNSSVEQLRLASAENEPLRNAVSGYIHYQLPRTEDIARRQGLADLKKSVWHEPLIQSDPDTLKRDESAIHVSLSAQEFDIGYRALAMTFDDAHERSQRGNYLQVGSLSLGIRQDKTVIKEITLWQAEAVRERWPSSRYIDITHKRYISPQEANETYARLGAGLGTNSNGYSFAITPFAGIRYSQTMLQSEGSIEFGVRASAEKSWSSHLETRVVTIERTTNLPFEKETFLVTNKLSINPQTNLFYKIELDELGQWVHSLGFSTTL